MGAEATIELRAADGWYGEVHAVKALTLSVRQGHGLALLGRNGAGKSTALKLLAGVLSPRRGSVFCDGEDITDTPVQRRVRLGVSLVPEGRGMLPALSVEDNLRLGAYWHRPRRQETKALLDEIYELLPRLAERRRQPAGSLSGGEQQMVATGRALMSKPRFLLLDEPSLGLAPQAIEVLYELLEQLTRRSIGIVLVEQYAEQAGRVCDQAAVLDKGRMILSGAAADVLADPTLAAVHLGTAPVAAQTP